MVWLIRGPGADPPDSLNETVKMTAYMLVTKPKTWAICRFWLQVSNIYTFCLLLGRFRRREKKFWDSHILFIAIPPSHGNVVV